MSTAQSYLNPSPGRGGWEETSEDSSCAQAEVCSCLLAAFLSGVSEALGSGGSGFKSRFDFLGLCEPGPGAEPDGGEEGTHVSPTLPPPESPWEKATPRSFLPFLGLLGAVARRLSGPPASWLRCFRGRGCPNPAVTESLAMRQEAKDSDQKLPSGALAWLLGRDEDPGVTAVCLGPSPRGWRWSGWWGPGVGGLCASREALLLWGSGCDGQALCIARS